MIGIYLWQNCENFCRQIHGEFSVDFRINVQKIRNISGTFGKTFLDKIFEKKYSEKVVSPGIKSAVY